MFGLLGVTLLGAILSTRQATALRDGTAPVQAFLSGYQLALIVAAIIVNAGVPISWYALRARRTPPPPPRPATPPSGDVALAVPAAR